MNKEKEINLIDDDTVPKKSGKTNKGKKTRNDSNSSDSEMEFNDKLKSKT